MGRARRRRRPHRRWSGCSTTTSATGSPASAARPTARATSPRTRSPGSSSHGSSAVGPATLASTAPAAAGPSTASPCCAAGPGSRSAMPAISSVWRSGPAGPVGLDVEQVRDVADLDALAGHVRSPVERARDGLDPAAFFRTWTRKEAAGQGDRRRPGDADDRDHARGGRAGVERWTGPGAPHGPMWLHDLSPAPDHPAAVAGPGDARPGDRRGRRRRGPARLTPGRTPRAIACPRSPAPRESAQLWRAKSRSGLARGRSNALAGGSYRLARGLPCRLARHVPGARRAARGGPELSVGGATMRGWVRVGGCCTSTWTRSTPPSSSSPVPRCATGRCWSAGSGRAGSWPGRATRPGCSGRGRRCRWGRRGGCARRPWCCRPAAALYSAVSEQVMAVLAEAAPVVEPVSLDEAFLEPPALAGASPAEVAEFGTALRAAVRARTGLPASVGAGSGKQLAKIASELAKPDGLRVVAPDEEQRRAGAAAGPRAVGRRARSRRRRCTGSASARSARSPPWTCARSPTCSASRSAPSCTGSPAGSTTGRSLRAGRRSRSAPRPPSTPTSPR